MRKISFIICLGVALDVCAAQNALIHVQKRLSYLSLYAQQLGIPLAPPVESNLELLELTRRPPSPRSGIPQKGQIGELTLGRLLPQRLLGEDPSIVHPSRTALIFLDDSEEDLGALTVSAAAALYQEAGPIIISASLLKNIFGRAIDEKAYFVNEEIIKKIIKQRLSSVDFILAVYKELQGPGLNGNEKYEGFRFGLLVKSFHPEHWHIAQVNPDLYLLVPLSYMRGDAQPRADFNGLSERELHLGLKIDHMKHYEWAGFLKIIRDYKSSYHAYASYFMSALYSQKANFSALFITRLEYTTINEGLTKKFLMPQWTVYITGHGSLGKSIIGVSISDFIMFIEFLSNKILTKLFVYSSCYAAGTSAKLVYENLQKMNAKQSFLFPIVLEGESDVTVQTSKPNVDLSDDHLMLQFYCLFRMSDGLGFVQQADAPDATLLNVIKPIFPSLRFILSPEFSVEASRFTNYPLFRPAGSDHFISLLPGIEITSVMAKTRTAPLDVVKAAQSREISWDVTTVLIHTRTVPFPLILRGQEKVPILSSAIPGKVIHFIASIESAYSFTSVIENMLRHYGVQKIFWIKKFVDKHAIPERTFTDVMVDIPGGDPHKAVVFYTDDQGKFFVIKNKKFYNPEALNRSYMKDYNNVRFSHAIDQHDVKGMRDIIMQGFRPDNELMHELQTQENKEIFDLVMTQSKIDATLIEAYKSNNIEGMKQALQRGANPNTYINKLPILCANIYDDKMALQKMELLRGAGADIQIRDEWGKTCLMRACSLLHKDEVAFLLQHGADPNITNKGQTALMEVFEGPGFRVGFPKTAPVVKSVISILQLLLSAGADSTQKNEKGQTVFDLIKGEGPQYQEIRDILHAPELLLKSAQANDIAGVKRALALGAHPNRIYADGVKISIFKDIFNITYEMLSLLVQAGAEIPEDRKTHYFNMAILKSDIDTIRLLLTQHVDINNTASLFGDTPLMKVADAIMPTQVTFEILELLLASGADLNKRNKDGKTAIDLAFDERIKRLLQIFQEERDKGMNAQEAAKAAAASIKS